MTSTTLVPPPEVLRPDRARLTAVLACVAARPLDLGPANPAWAERWLVHPFATGAIVQPQAAWEALAGRGVIPMAWIDDPARAFRREGAAADGPGEPEAVDLPWPPTLRACVTLASDPGGVTTAEALAREAARDERARVGRPAPYGLVWRVLDARRAARHVAQAEAERLLSRATGASAALDILRLGDLLDEITDDAVVLVALEV